MVPVSVLTLHRFNPLKYHSPNILDGHVGAKDRNVLLQESVTISLGMFSIRSLNSFFVKQIKRKFLVDSELSDGKRNDINYA